MDRTLEYLTAVSECGGLSKAARRLFITPAALSKFVIQRETELGVPLFQRDGNHFSLTYAGERYLELLKDVDAAQTRLNEEMKVASDLYTGKLRIGFQRSFSELVVKHILSRLCEKNPGIPVSFTEDSAPVMKQMLAGNKLDLVLCTAEEEDPRFKEVRILESPIVLAGRKDEDLLKRTERREGFPYPWLPDDVIAEVGFLDNEGDQVKRYAPHLYGKMPDKNRNTLIIGGAGTALLCAEEGMGLAPISELLVRELHFYDRVQLYSFGPWQRSTWLTVLYDPRTMKEETVAGFTEEVIAHYQNMV